MNINFFESRIYKQNKIAVNGFKHPILTIALICTSLIILLIESNVLKYLDPGAGSFLIQLMIAGLTSCSLCGVPMAIIGGVVYFLTKNRRKNTQSDSTEETNT